MLCGGCSMARIVIIVILKGYFINFEKKERERKEKKWKENVLYDAEENHLGRAHPFGG